MSQLSASSDSTTAAPLSGWGMADYSAMMQQLGILG
jgi:hypothetical protein